MTDRLRDAWIQIPGRRLVVVAGLFAVFAAASPQPVAAASRDTGPLVVKTLEQNLPFVRKGVTIQGKLDLSNLEIKQPFECIDCHFTDQLLARDTIFDRTVDLSGSTFDQGLDMQRATFTGTAVFGSPSGMPGPAGPADFLKAADFSLATFKDLADFQGVAFRDAAQFDLARFKSDALFTDATFDGDTNFESAVFEGAARFDTGGLRPSLFLETPTFDRSSFTGAADFRNQLFCSSASFQKVNFGAHAEFNNTKFNYDVDFTDAHFAADGIFRNALFYGVGVDTLRSANFDHVVAVGALDLSGATVGNRMDFTPGMVAGSLSLTDIDFSRNPGVPLCAILKKRKKLTALAQKGRHTQGGRQTEKKQKGKKGKAADDPIIVHIDGLRSSGFTMELDAIDRYVAPGEREQAVGLVESSAKTRGDLGLANDAHYRLQTLKSSHYWGPVHVLDVAFYRWTAGYLVRPIHPLFALLTLALLVSFWNVHFPARRRRRLSLRVRLFPSRWRLVAARFRSVVRKLLAVRVLVLGLARRVLASLTPRAIGAGLSAFWVGFCRYAHELLDTLTLMWPTSGASRAGRRLEAAVYRVLFVCMLVGFANSNPTLRQMLDALL